MVKSMTGFGRSETNVAGVKIVAEIKSLNSKGLDIVIKLPKEYNEKEYELRNEIAQHVVRGKVSVSIYCETENEVEANLPLLNDRALDYYLKYHKTLSQHDNIELDFARLLLLPGVMDSTYTEEEKDNWPNIKLGFKQALDAFNAFRITEGKETGDEMVRIVKGIASKLVDIEIHEPARIENARDRLNKTLSELGPHVDFDKSRFEEEMVYWLEKLDISEEKIRLKQHCTYFNETLLSDPTAGKKLGFIAQEMGREINTIGSKANYFLIQQIVVEMKNELEKIKEQVLNIL
jgi:uncharacterized protein (TIGR00255 family)